MISNDRWWQSMIVVDSSRWYSQWNIHKDTRTIQHISKHDPYFDQICKTPTSPREFPGYSQGLKGRIELVLLKKHRFALGPGEATGWFFRWPVAHVWKKPMCIHVLPTPCKASIQPQKTEYNIYIYTYIYSYTYILYVYIYIYNYLYIYIYI